QLSLIVEVDDGDALRQSLIDLGNFLLDSLNYLLRVLIDSLENDSCNNLTLAVFGDCALSYLVSDLDFRNVTDAYGCTVPRIKNDVLDVLNVFNQSQTANDVLFITMLDKVRAGVLVVRLDCIEECF